VVLVFFFVISWEYDFEVLFCNSEEIISRLDLVIIIIICGLILFLFLVLCFFLLLCCLELVLCVCLILPLLLVFISDRLFLVPVVRKISSISKKRKEILY
jgi:hypothetical protein